MNIPHLNDDELNLSVIGEELPAEAAEHLAGCLACRRRRDAFLALVEQARGVDPDEVTRARVRTLALTAWGASPRRHWVRWLSAAAAVIVLSLLPLLRSHAPQSPAINTEAVMTEVDQMLERDPLAAMASEEVVDTVVPVSHGSGEGSVS